MAEDRDQWWVVTNMVMNAIIQKNANKVDYKKHIYCRSEILHVSASRFHQRSYIVV